LFKFCLTDNETRICPVNTVDSPAPGSGSVILGLSSSYSQERLNTPPSLVPPSHRIDDRNSPIRGTQKVQNHMEFSPHNQPETDHGPMTFSWNQQGHGSLKTPYYDPSIPGYDQLPPRYTGRQRQNSARFEPLTSSQMVSEPHENGNVANPLLCSLIQPTGSPPETRNAHIGKKFIIV